MKKRLINLLLASIYCLMLTGFPFQAIAEESQANPVLEEDPFAISEDDMFSDSETVESVEEYQDEKIAQEADSSSFGISGHVKGIFQHNKARETSDPSSKIEDSYTADLETNFLLDARLGYGLKFFSDIWISYSALEETGNNQRQSEEEDEEDYEIVVREIFGDLNIMKKVYFRAGKQTLKWGQGYFWNPTDLINKERKDIQNVETRREGTYGLKMHVPFGTSLNIYSFIDITDAETSDDYALAGKLEFLILNNVEVSFSSWNKKDFQAVYGFDISTYQFETQWRSELSLTKGGNQHRLEEQDGMYVDTYDEDKWISQFVFGFTRRFDIGDISDRLSLTGEFFYNENGYDENMFEDPRVRAQFLVGGYYVPNQYGKTYAAVFSSFSRFLNVSDLTLNVNTIGNLSDSSYLLETSLNYEIDFDTSITVNLTNYLGEENREYTLSGNTSSAKVSITRGF